ncbi:MAG: hypothetical protein C5B49_15600 [Bdellovibrio sp.]|nr:MAG: hypothetical protein C5B49_15600 [Bdellovibrio sp.]
MGTDLQLGNWRRKTAGLLFMAAPFCGSLQAIAQTSNTPSNLPFGYISDIESEREDQYSDVLLSPPEVKMNLDLRSRIFTGQLIKEFRTRYQEKFGYVDTDGMAFAADRLTGGAEGGGAMQDMQAQNEERRKYAEYVVKRLGEWHFDQYMKSDPSMRPVYEAKEKLSHVQLEVAQETKVQAKYSISDNSVEVEVANPNTSAKVRSDSEDRWLMIGRKLGQTLNLLTSYAISDGLAAVELRRQHSAALSSSLKTTTTLTPGGRSPRQSFFGYAFYYLF